MRWIRKTNEPRELKEWRERYVSDINFGYGLLPGELKETVKEFLLAEQGWLCAYTGRRIESESSHLEHVKAQAHCERGEDVDYFNIVACFPAPNTGQCDYGAHPKADWPAPAERIHFVSPLDPNSEAQFTFSLKGEIKPVDPDRQSAARQTITRLQLCHQELTAMRKEAIQGTLGKENNLSLKDANRRLHKLEMETSGRLEPFCFVLIQALRKHIRRLEYIRESRRRTG